MITEEQIAELERFMRGEDPPSGSGYIYAEAYAFRQEQTALALCAEWRENKLRTEGFAAELEKLFPETEKPCKTCGQPRGRHRAGTLQCPVGECIGFLDTTFTP